MQTQEPDSLKRDILGITNLNKQNIKMEVKKNKKL